MGNLHVTYNDVSSDLTRILILTQPVFVLRYDLYG